MRKYLILIIATIAFLYNSVTCISQTDSLVFKNGNYIIGEIKNMDKGVLVIETDYSDSDFKIEWSGVKEIYSTTNFLITIADGSRYNGTILTTGNREAYIITDTDTISVKLQDLVFLNSVDKGFKNRLYAAIGVGLDLTKANNLVQLSVRSNVGYLANRWSADASYNTLYSKQDSSSRISRTDGGGSFKYFLPRDWFSVASVAFLSNTEQKIDLRTTGSLGVGKYVIHTNRTYWAFSGGASFNNETYTTDDPKRDSWEAYAGTELNLFDLGDFNLITKLVMYPSLTESGRLRSDFNIDTKYDLPLDFYIKISCTVNYDNRPVEGAAETDYIFHTGFGWEW